MEKQHHSIYKPTLLTVTTLYFASGRIPEFATRSKHKTCCHFRLPLSALISLLKPLHYTLQYDLSHTPKMCHPIHCCIQFNLSTACFNLHLLTTKTLAISLMQHPEGHASKTYAARRLAWLRARAKNSLCGLI